MTTTYLDRPGGRLAYEVTGDGPLILCSPGMGDLRSTFGELAGALAADGFRVATADLRGHGESSTGWDSYEVAAIAGDLLALNQHLGGHAVLVGNSYSGSAAVVAAAREPDAFAGLVLDGAFVRDHPPGLAARLTMKLVTTAWPGRPLWTTAAWPTFFKRRPANFEARREELKKSLARPHGYDAVRAMANGSGHAATEPLLKQVRTRALVIMGSADPDFPDPAAEARFTADALGGDAEVLMVDGVGHYPHAEAPEIVAPAVAKFARA